MPHRTTTTLHRYAWQVSGQTLGRAASFVALVITARELGLDQYGRFVVLLALVEAAMVPWKATVLQAAAAAAVGDGDGNGWAATVGRWWLIGSLALGPIALVFDGVGGLLALLAASVASGLMFLGVPRLFREGKQRRFALGSLAAQSTRLAATVLLAVAGGLTPRTALLAVAAGSLVGAAAMWTSGETLSGRPRWFGYEVGTEALKWTEMHAPILLVAVLLGLPSAGGFDLLYKLVQAAAQLLAGIGVVMLPAFLRGDEPPGRTVARSLRLPTAAAVVVAVGVAVAIGPLLDEVTAGDLGLGWAPAAFAAVLVLAPWMGVSRTALVVLGEARWLIPSQAAVSVAAVSAGLLAFWGVVWAAAAVSLAVIIGGVIRWAGLRSAGALPAGRWLAPGEWIRDVRWMGDAVRRRRPV